MFTNPDNEKVEAARKVGKSLKKRIFGYLAAGLGLVAGLAWNDAIKAVIDHFLPDNASTIIAKVVYALAITIIISLVLFSVEKSEDDKS